LSTSSNPQGAAASNLAAITKLPPFLIEPQFVARIWGSSTLRPWFPVDATDNPIGEVWLTGDECRVASGPAAGQTLAALVQAAPQALIGEPAQGNSKESASPLLIKLLFARQKLSVQVHPDDALAQKQGFPRGKTECWYVLQAQAGAEVAVGFKPELQSRLTLHEVRSHALDGSLESCLNLLGVAAGEMILVDAGTVHAIHPGSVLLEVQQNSDQTFRLFDYGRPRPLHLEQSLEALKFTTKSGKVAPQRLADRTLLLSTQYFKIESITTKVPLSSANLARSDSEAQRKRPLLSYLFVLRGKAKLTPAGNGEIFEPVDLAEHAIVAIPASSPGFLIETLSELEFLRIVALIE
jgi:mannose-6-phosphate isomerase